jgi:Flp pilus assembly pilin Flp
MSDLMVALYARVTSAVLSLRDDDEGQSMVEYGLIIVLVAVIASTAFIGLAGKLGDVITTIKNTFDKTS